jgi:hypothetical protein
MLVSQFPFALFKVKRFLHSPLQLVGKVPAESEDTILAQFKKLSFCGIFFISRQIPKLESNKFSLIELSHLPHLSPSFVTAVQPIKMDTPFDAKIGVLVLKHLS